MPLRGYETPSVPPAHSETLRVRYSDTDAQGIVHHSSYFLWLEEARLGWLREAIFAYTDLTASGLFLSLVECPCRFIAPAYGEDLVTVLLWPERISRVRVCLRYEVRRDETLLATASSENAFVGTDGRPRRLPAKHAAWNGLRSSIGD